jgi:UDP-N-acetylmuramoyl-tripeptide--D-alanyl-D-alanine ligase
MHHIWEQSKEGYIAMRATKRELVEVLGPQVVHSVGGDGLVCGGVEFDSRKIKGGEIFIALPGETTHGNEFVLSALDRGANLCLIEAREQDKFEEQDRLIVVNDSLEAFSTVARWWRAKLNTPTIAVTGSVGKTSLKELTARLLAVNSRGLYSQKSFNNHVGVPYTLCQLKPEHEWCVLEMGMNHFGELRHLTLLGLPDHAVITKIAPAHIEFFGTLEKICQAKLEIIEGVADSGCIILNADDPVLMKGFDALPENAKRTPLYFGKRSLAQQHNRTLAAWFDNVKSHLLDGISFDLGVGDESATVHMKIIGVHNAQNAACAVLAARTLIPGIPFSDIVKTLENYVAPLMRLDIRNCYNGTRIVDDSYNANPESMGAMIELAKEIAEAGVKVGLVLGDMKEMGDLAREAHRDIGHQVASLPAAFCVCVGEEMKACYEVLSKTSLDVVHVPGASLAAEHVLRRPWEVLLVKGSRSVGLDQTVSNVLSVRGEIPPDARIP